MAQYEKKKDKRKAATYLQPRKFHSSAHNSSNVSFASFDQAIPRSLFSDLAATIFKKTTYAPRLQQQ